MKFIEGIEIKEIIIIESLREADRKTGKELSEKLQKTITTNNFDLVLDFVSVKTVDEFWRKLDSIEQSALEVPPLLHLEMHGGNDVFQLASNETISWNELWQFYGRLYAKTGKKIFSCLSACVSVNVLNEVSVQNQTPVWAVVVSNDSVGEDDLLNSYLAFYTDLLTHKSVATAADNIPEHFAGKMIIRVVHLLAFFEKLVENVDKKYFQDIEKRQKLEDEAVAMAMSEDAEAFGNDLELARKMIKNMYENIYLMFAAAKNQFWNGSSKQ